MTTTASQTITLIKTLPKFSYQDNSAEKEFEIQGILLNQLLHGISAIDLDGNIMNLWIGWSYFSYSGIK